LKRPTRQVARRLARAFDAVELTGLFVSVVFFVGKTGEGR